MKNILSVFIIIGSLSISCQDNKATEVTKTEAEWKGLLTPSEFHILHDTVFLIKRKIRII